MRYKSFPNPLKVLTVNPFKCYVCNLLKEVSQANCIEGIFILIKIKILMESRRKIKL